VSTEENKALVRRIYDVHNKHNLAALEDLYTRDYVVHSTGVFPDLDRAGLKQLMPAVWTAFPDMHYVVEDMIAEGDKVATRLTFRGTHQGELMGIPPTGKVVRVTGIYISRFAGGKCVEDWRQVDDLGFLQQLGAIPQMAPTGA
jgi:steroid delta-isomerase-like uncharacterized protein